MGRSRRKTRPQQPDQTSSPAVPRYETPPKVGPGQVLEEEQFAEETAGSKKRVRNHGEHPLSLAFHKGQLVSKYPANVPEKERITANERFAAGEAWFGHPIVNLKSAEYASCEDVWQKTRYMAGIGGARCTVEMKKAVRQVFEREWHPDSQAFGYTADETDRADNFRQTNPEVALVTLLIAEGLRKEDCHAIVDRAGIVLPLMYRLGFNNANCIGCVQAQSPSYWNRVRRHFPAVFSRRAALSRELGVRLVKLTAGTRERLFLDELDPNMGAGEVDPAMECSLLCYMAERQLVA